MRVELVSWTENPLATVLDIWDLSKSEKRLEGLELRTSAGITDKDLSEADVELFRQIIAQEIPVSEHVTFNFAIEDAPIAWREQAVRHRVGFKKGDNYAVDMFPEDGATFWSQSMRLLDMSTFAEDGAYFTPESIADNAPAAEIYHQAMSDIEAAYHWLVIYGIPLEDARNLIPVGATHRIMMTVNLRALKHIVGKRGCWILQSSLWKPIIQGIIAQLAERVHPVFRELAYPPCVRGGQFVECTFKLENARRVTGDDPLPVCPLYWTSEMSPENTEGPPMLEEVEQRIPEYAGLWNQPKLGETWEWEDR